MKFECEEGGPKKASCDGVCITGDMTPRVCSHLIGRFSVFEDLMKPVTKDQALKVKEE